MSSAGAPAVSDVFGALAHPIRRQIVMTLASGDRAVQQLAAALPVSRPAVSQHLAVLRSVGLVTQQRSGRRHLYRLRREPLDDVRSWLATLDSFWSARLLRLGALLDAANQESRQPRERNLMIEIGISDTPTSSVGGPSGGHG